MGASFRNTGQIIGLAGCDLLTISPDLLQKLADGDAPVARKLSEASAQAADLTKISLDEKAFRLMLNDDASTLQELGSHLFGLTSKESNYLFMPHASGLGDDATAVQVATHIREFCQCLPYP